MSQATRRIGGKEGPRQRTGVRVATGLGGKINITVNGVRVPVSAELEAAVRLAYRGSQSVPPKEMTTTQAARFLDVSRPFVIKLIARGELPCRLVGKHRRIPAEALTAYKESMFQRARSAADEMARAAQALGLYDSDHVQSRGR